MKMATTMWIFLIGNLLNLSAMNFRCGGSMCTQGLFQSRTKKDQMVADHSPPDHQPILDNSPPDHRQSVSRRHGIHHELKFEGKSGASDEVGDESPTLVNNGDDDQGPKGSDEAPQAFDRYVDGYYYSPNIIEGNIPPPYNYLDGGLKLLKDGTTTQLSDLRSDPSGYRLKKPKPYNPYNSGETADVDIDDRLLSTSNVFHNPDDETSYLVEKAEEYPSFSKLPEFRFTYLPGYHQIMDDIHNDWELEKENEDHGDQDDGDQDHGDQDHGGLVRQRKSCDLDALLQEEPKILTRMIKIVDKEEERKKSASKPNARLPGMRYIFEQDIIATGRDGDNNNIATTAVGDTTVGGNSNDMGTAKKKVRTEVLILGAGASGIVFTIKNKEYPKCENQIVKLTAEELVYDDTNISGETGVSGETIGVLNPSILRRTNGQNSLTKTLFVNPNGASDDRSTLSSSRSPYLKIEKLKPENDDVATMLNKTSNVVSGGADHDGMSISRHHRGEEGTTVRASSHNERPPIGTSSVNLRKEVAKDVKSVYYLTTQERLYGGSLIDMFSKEDVADRVSVYVLLEVLKIIRDIQGLVHGDLKAENIMIIREKYEETLFNIDELKILKYPLWNTLSIGKNPQSTTTIGKKNEEIKRRNEEIDFLIKHSEDYHFVTPLLKLIDLDYSRDMYSLVKPRATPQYSEPSRLMKYNTEELNYMGEKLLDLKSLKKTSSSDLFMVKGRNEKTTAERTDELSLLEDNSDRVSMMVDENPRVVDEKKSEYVAKKPKYIARPPLTPSARRPSRQDYYRESKFEKFLRDYLLLLPDNTDIRLSPGMDGKEGKPIVRIIETNSVKRKPLLMDEYGLGSLAYQMCVNQWWNYETLVGVGNRYSGGGNRYKGGAYHLSINQRQNQKDASQRSGNPEPRLPFNHQWRNHVDAFVDMMLSHIYAKENANGAKRRNMMFSGMASGGNPYAIAQGYSVCGPSSTYSPDGKTALLAPRFPLPRSYQTVVCGQQAPPTSPVISSVSPGVEKCERSFFGRCFCPASHTKQLFFGARRFQNVGHSTAQGSEHMIPLVSTTSLQPPLCNAPPASAMYWMSQLAIPQQRQQRTLQADPLQHPLQKPHVVKNPLLCGLNKELFDVLPGNNYEIIAPKIPRNYGGYRMLRLDQFLIAGLAEIMLREWKIINPHTHNMSTNQITKTTRRLSAGELLELLGDVSGGDGSGFSSRASRNNAEAIRISGLTEKSHDLLTVWMKEIKRRYRPDLFLEHYEKKKSIPRGVGCGVM